MKKDIKMQVNSKLFFELQDAIYRDLAWQVPGLQPDDLDDVDLVMALATEIIIKNLEKNFVKIDKKHLH